jgi:hypothetical protein
MSKVLVKKESGSKTLPLSPLGLPTKPELLAEALGVRLAIDTKRIDDALVAALQEELLNSLNSWFGRRPPEVDQGLLKRLTNALLSAGKSGTERTLASLQSISDSTWERHVNKITSEKAAETLREQTADFRRASAYIDHQAKCVKTFLKVITERSDEVPDRVLSLIATEVDSSKKFQDWSVRLAHYWSETTHIDMKNRSMYQSYWSEFTSVLIKTGDFDYADYLATKTQRYLLEANQDLFKRAYRRIKDTARKADNLDIAPKSALKLDSGQASLSTTFPLPESSVQQIKEDLLFMFATDKLLQQQQLEIFVSEDDEKTLVVKFSPPKEMLTYRRVIQALNSNIEAAYSQISKQ